MTELKAAMRKLKLHKAPGSDQITNEMIINLGSNGMAVLLRIINITWKTGQRLEDRRSDTLTEEEQTEKCTIQLQANITDIMHRKTGREDDKRTCELVARTQQHHHTMPGWLQK